MNGLGIVAALAAEARSLGAASPPLRTPTELPDGTLLILSGVGTTAAADGARRLAEAGVHALLSWGMAGGLDPALSAGTLVLPTEVVSAEGSAFRTAPEWREQVSSAVMGGHPVSSGRLLSCAEALGRVEEKSLAFRRTAAVAVDMESIAIAQVAAAARLPFLAVRAIVDRAVDQVPSGALAALTPGTGALRVGRVVAALLRTPSELPALMRLSLRYGSARRALTAVARSGALAPRNCQPALGRATS